MCPFTILLYLTDCCLKLWSDLKRTREDLATRSCCFRPALEQSSLSLLQLGVGHVCRAEYWRIFLFATLLSLRGHTFHFNSSFNHCFLITVFDVMTLFSQLCFVYLCVNNNISTQTELLSTIHEAPNSKNRTFSSSFIFTCLSIWIKAAGLRFSQYSVVKAVGSWEAVSKDSCQTLFRAFFSLVLVRRPPL